MRAAFKTIVEAGWESWFSTNISNSIFLLTQKHNALMFRRTTLTKLSEAGVLWHVLVIEGKEWQKVGWDYNWENGTTAPIWKCLQAGWLDQASTTNDFVGTYRQSSRRRVPIKSISSLEDLVCAAPTDDRATFLNGGNMHHSSSD